MLTSSPDSPTNDGVSKPLHVSVEENGETDAGNVGGLKIPKFAKSLKRPAFSLTESLTGIYRYSPSDTDSSRRNVDSANAPPAGSGPFYVVKDLSEKFTEKSLAAFMNRFAKGGGSIQTCIPKFKMVSVNENFKGKFADDPRFGATISISSIGLAVTHSNAPEYMLAYGRRSPFEPVGSADEFTWDTLRLIHNSVGVQYRWQPNPPTSELPQSKFGGGLARRSAGVVSVPFGRFLIRTKGVALDQGVDEEWKRRGAVSVEQVGDEVIARFSRMEVRDFACDSFIVVAQLTASNRQIGITTLRLVGTECMAVIENVNDSSAQLTVFPPVTPQMFFPETYQASVIQQSPSEPPMMPSPMPRRYN